MKWAGLYFLGFATLVGGVLAALWKLGMLQEVSGTWIAIGVVAAIGVGIMGAVAQGVGKGRVRVEGG